MTARASGQTGKSRARLIAHVSATDLRNGIAGDPRQCAVARALKRAAEQAGYTVEAVHVSSQSALIWVGEGRSVARLVFWPVQRHVVSEYIAAFDHDFHHVEPRQITYREV